MRKRYFSFIALSLLLLLTACTGLPTITINQATPGVTNIGTGEEQQLEQFKQINLDRTANNLPPLTWEPRLEKSAYQHDLVMAKGCGLAHQGSDEPGRHFPSVGSSISPFGTSDVTTCFSIDDASNMVTTIHKGMMSEKPPDDGHRRNLLSKDFHRIGISIYIDSNNTLWLTEDLAN